MSGQPPIDLEPPAPPEPAPPKEAPPPKEGSGTGATPSDDGPQRVPSTRDFVVMAAVILVAAAVAFLAVYALPVRFDEGPGRIVILLVAGLVALTLLLYLGTIIHRTAGVGTSQSALGMPEGSIRALIALSLVLLFAIIGITVLYSGIGTQEEIVSTGISSAQIAELENVQIISISIVDPAASPGTERYTVIARPEISEAGQDFGLQLLTTVSTLVVAVAGFYFGSKAVASGSAVALAAVARRPTTPDEPVVGSGTTGDTAGPGSDGGATVSDELDAGDLIPAIEDGATDEVEGTDEAATGEPGDADDEDAPGATTEGEADHDGTGTPGAGPTT